MIFIHSENYFFVAIYCTWPNDRSCRSFLEKFNISSSFQRPWERGCQNFLVWRLSLETGVYNLKAFSDDVLATLAEYCKTITYEIFSM